MPEVFIPALLQDLTGGVEQVDLPGESVRAVIDALEQRYPGIRARLMEGERVRTNIAVVVDGEVNRKRERAKLQPESEVHFLPAISGGRGSSNR